MLTRTVMVEPMKTRTTCLALALLALASCTAPQTAQRDILSNPAAYTTTGGGSWTRLEGGILEVRPGAGNLVTRDEFGDARFTLEFWCPLTDAARGQDRGNSGVYIQGRYEVQILDSYDEPLALGSCGAIYSIAAPLENACLMAEAWQSYVIDFTAARFDGSGRVTENPRMSVWHNGILIHDDVELPHPTPGGLGQNVVALGPLMLQDHNQKVRFRNLTVTPKDDEGWGFDVSFGAGMLTD